MRGVPPTARRRGTTEADASAARLATSGTTDVYVSEVMVTDECRSIACTTFMSVPAAGAIVAAPCRRPCSRIGGSPASKVSRRNSSVSVAGWSGAPFSWAKTCPAPSHVSPHASRSSFCRARCAFNASTVASSSAMVASLSSVLVSASSTSQPSCRRCLRTVSVPAVRSTSGHRSPHASPRRSPWKPPPPGSPCTAPTGSTNQAPPDGSTESSTPTTPPTSPTSPAATATPSRTPPTASPPTARPHRRHARRLHPPRHRIRPRRPQLPQPLTPTNPKERTRP